MYEHCYLVVKVKLEAAPQGVWPSKINKIVQRIAAAGIHCFCDKSRISELFALDDVVISEAFFNLLFKLRPGLE